MRSLGLVGGLKILLKAGLTITSRISCFFGVSRYQNTDLECKLRKK